MIKAYWWTAKNFGDTLTPYIVGHFTGQKIEFAQRNDTGKLLAVGSILVAIKENDVVWGAGWHKHKNVYKPKTAKILALRGPLTHKLLIGAGEIDVFGDPAILLPLIYQPKVEKKYKVGIIPHYVDRPFCKINDGEKYINIQNDWKTVIDEIVSCETIKSSSLHGIIAAEAYGIPTQWAVYSNKILGGELKFQDYFLGSGRQRQKPFTDIPAIQKLVEKQNNLIYVLKKHYGQN